jgi:hypothetical protein
VVVVVVMDLYISTIACQYQHRMDEDHHHQLTNAILVAMNVPAHTEHAQIEFSRPGVGTLLFSGVNFDDQTLEPFYFQLSTLTTSRWSHLTDNLIKLN